mgnify:CR=1 FL=1
MIVWFFGKLLSVEHLEGFFFIINHLTRDRSMGVAPSVEPSYSSSGFTLIAQFQSTEVIRGTAFIPEDRSDRQKNPERFCNADGIKKGKHGLLQDEVEITSDAPTTESPFMTMIAPFISGYEGSPNS